MTGERMRDLTMMGDWRSWRLAELGRMLALFASSAFLVTLLRRWDKLGL